MPRSLYMKYTVLGAGLVILDQITKYLIRACMMVGESIPVLGDFFCITYVRNTGAAFSMLSGQRGILILLPLVIVAGALWFFFREKEKHWLFCISWTLIIAGGIGNLIDRIWFGWVTDMLDLSFFPPVFNIADIGVTAGCAMFVIYVLMEDRFQKYERERTEV